MSYSLVISMNVAHLLRLMKISAGRSGRYRIYGREGTARAPINEDTWDRFRMRKSRPRTFRAKRVGSASHVTCLKHDLTGGCTSVRRSLGYGVDRRSERN